MAASATVRRLLSGRTRSTISERTGTAVDAAVTTASLNRSGPGGRGSRPGVSKSPLLGLLLGLAVDGTAVVRAGLVLARYPLAHRIEDGQALADQAGGDLAEAVG